MTASRSYPIPNSFSDAHVTPERYEALYQQSLETPQYFGRSRRRCLIGIPPGMRSPIRISVLELLTGSSALDSMCQ